MSGIVGIFRRDGAPVERPLLAALTNFLSFRGPDAQELWLDGATGFGHTMLRTTREAAHERQPTNLRSDFWITADVRLDCRAELIESLIRADCKFEAQRVTDPELILHAYATWREECVDHLRGDFAFALWDARERKLFCARDHFGIKPFFYSASERQFLFSNTLNCLRAHPDVSDELNEAAIGDFLLFGLNCEIATTTFSEIQRLPPAHFLIVRADGLRTQRYWSPPIDGRIRYARPEEYVEHFREILKAAVADRLRTDRVGIFLSGGLDSGSIAAMARELSPRSTGRTDLYACNSAYETLIASEESYFARQTAEFLYIPIGFLAMDDFQLFDAWDDPDKVPPEPIEEPLSAAWSEEKRFLSAHARVGLSGTGGDNLLHFQMRPYAKDLLRRHCWGTLFKDMAQYLWIRPFPWKGLRAKIAGLAGKKSGLEPGYPNWIEANFAERMRLTKRWKDNVFEAPATHPLRPKGHASLALPYWTYSFELADPSETRALVEVRYPYLDLRMVNYLLAIPTFPWSFQKRLIREAMAGRLPDVTRLRAKTPLAENPVSGALRRGKQIKFEEVQFEKEFERFVDTRNLGESSGPKTQGEASLLVRALCLNFWLRSALRRYTVTVGGN